MNLELSNFLHPSTNWSIQLFGGNDEFLFFYFFYEHIRAYNLLQNIKILFNVKISVVALIHFM